ncbi:MAG: hypothetical protein H6907_13215 [Hyphomicrobiales bacterium]|nr:hypothetical protein [Hyphomicrobiales bacterium]
MSHINQRAGKSAPYSYQDTLAASQRVNWRIEDIIGGDRKLDFSRPFLPESLAGVADLTFLSPDERLAMNQIRGHTYLYLFGLVEEFILPFVVDHARPRLSGDDFRTRAFLQFASEEAKHIHLFKRFREEFLRGFGSTCDVIGPPEDIAKAVLSHHPLAVALVILHIEWMTQRHYLDSVRDERDLDPQFKSLLKHHWMEEAQHAKLDTLMVENLAAECDRDEIDQAIGGYLAIGGLLDGGIAQQVEFDIDAMARATGRVLADDERARMVAAQRQTARWTFLGSGMTHENFLDSLGGLSASGRARVEMVAPTFC